MEKKPEGERLRIINNSWRTVMGSQEWLQEYPFLAEEPYSGVCLSHIPRLVEVQAQSGFAGCKKGLQATCAQDNHLEGEMPPRIVGSD